MRQLIRWIWKEKMEINKNIRVAFGILGIVFGCFCIVKYSSALQNQEIDFAGSGFTVTFQLTVIGIVSAIIALLYSNIERIRESLMDKNILTREMEGKIEEIFRELQQTVKFLLIILCVQFLFSNICLLDIATGSIELADLSVKSWGVVINLSAISLSIWGMFDVVSSLFNLVKVSRRLERKGG